MSTVIRWNPLREMAAMQTAMNRLFDETWRTAWPAAPGRIYRAPWSLVANADPRGSDITVSLT